MKAKIFWSVLRSKGLEYEILQLIGRISQVDVKNNILWYPDFFLKWIQKFQNE